MRRTLLALLVAVLGPAALAASVPEYIKDSTGEWLVVTDDGKLGCRIRLAAERVGDLWRAMPTDACAARLPAVSRATSWDYQPEFASSAHIVSCSSPSAKTRRRL
jgi:hypothetical protein